MGDVIKKVCLFKIVYSFPKVCIICEECLTFQPLYFISEPQKPAGTSLIVKPRNTTSLDSWRSHHDVPLSLLTWPSRSKSDAPPTDVWLRIFSLLDGGDLFFFQESFSIYINMQISAFVHLETDRHWYEWLTGSKWLFITRVHIYKSHCRTLNFNNLGCVHDRSKLLMANDIIMVYSY